VQKLTTLNSLLSEANYKQFWSTLDGDDLYADLIADVAGFEELMRVRIAVTVGMSCREVERTVLEGWLQLKGADFEKFIREICGWGLDTTREGVKGGMVVIPVNKENEAKGTVARENVQFDRKFPTVGPYSLRGAEADCNRICTCYSKSL
jgi:translation initiation factor 3 subunit K